MTQCIAVCQQHEKQCEKTIQHEFHKHKDTSAAPLVMMHYWNDFYSGDEYPYVA